MTEKEQLRPHQTWIDTYFGNFKWYRKLTGGLWHKHQYTEDASQITLTPGNTFWARYGKLNRYTDVIDVESYS